MIQISEFEKDGSASALILRTPLLKHPGKGNFQSEADEHD
jgi:hypothetical protein